MKSGIYKITSPTGKVYIGQSVNIEKRHKNYNCKGQILLENSFKKYGRHNHKFETLEICGVEVLDEKENYYMDLYDSCNVLKGLNLMRPNGGVKQHSEESKNKNRIAHLGKTASEETKKLLSKLKTGKYVPKIVGENISKAKKNKPQTEEHKKAAYEARMASEKFRTHVRNLNSRKGRPVINTTTGKTYPSAKIAALQEGMLVGTLTPKLSGNKPNNTTLKYLD